MVSVEPLLWRLCTQNHLHMQQGPRGNRKRTVNNSHRNTHKALLRRPSRVGRRQTEHKDPGHIVKTHEVDPRERRVAVRVDVKEMDHESASHADQRRGDPENAAEVGDEEGNGRQDRLADHGDSGLRSGHQRRLGGAEAVARDDQRVEVGDSRVGHGVAQRADPDADAFRVACRFPYLRCFESL